MARVVLTPLYFVRSQVFEKSVQILALAISDLISDKYFELEGLFKKKVCNAQLSKTKNLKVVPDS